MNGSAHCRRPPHPLLSSAALPILRLIPAVPVPAAPLPAGIQPASRPPSGDPCGSSGAAGPAPWCVEPLQGWHLPLLDDPAFEPLQPLLQRSLLLALPERLLSALTPRQPMAPQVLVALSRSGPGRPLPLGLVVTRRLNRSGSCWRIEQLRLALALTEDSRLPGRQAITAGLLREAIQHGRGAASWITTASSLDDTRLAALREQGFQPLRTDRLWRWQPTAAAALPAAALPADLQLRPLQRRNATLLWHLEQTACPALLRQLLDRRVEDLLDQSQGRGWLLVDPSRNEAVAGVRWLADHPGGGQEVELSLHPGWGHLLGAATELLLRRIAGGGGALWLQSDVEDGDRQLWLEQLGAEAQGEQVLMARSVWRRQEWQPARRAARRLEAVLEQFQPRRRPVPTPVGPLSLRQEPR